ncbi:MAG: Ig-like domain-containing protein, partial [Coriobacteriales bacterium]|nr:Ig-like domain-containing protein [Coriobacteriales bacterium]
MLIKTRGSRLLIAVVAFFMLLAFVPFSTSAYAAESDGEFTVEDDVLINAEVVDDTLEIRVDITDNPGISFLVLELIWDPQPPTAFTKTKTKADIVIGEIFADSTISDRQLLSSSYATYDSFSIGASTVKASVGDGTLAIFKYSITPDTPDGFYSVAVKQIGYILQGSSRVTDTTPRTLDFTVSRHEAGTPVESIELDPEAASVPLGGTLTPNAHVLPEDATNKILRWSSDDTTIATVANGVVTPKAVGTTTITATAQDGSGVSASCEVTVYQPVTSVDLRSKNVNMGNAPFVLEVGGTSELFANIQPENADNK